MKQLGLAFHNYADVHGSLPPAVVYGPDGTPRYSWRVLLLPYVEGDSLYAQFKLDEPWDSPHNIQLLDRMPSTYAAPGSKRKLMPPNHTVCHVYAGPGSLFDGPKGQPLSACTDGLSNTLMIVEAGEPVPWTKPENIPFGPDWPVHPRTIFRDGFRVCLGDGSVRFLRGDVAEVRLRAAITRNGNEQISLDDAR